LRPQDRLIACELEPHAAIALAHHLRGPATTKVMRIDGWVALQAYVPAKERRGLVIVDPPFEQPDDFIRLADGMTAAHRKWPTGIYLMWYPVKGRDGPDRLIGILRHAGVEKCLRVEFAVAPPQAVGGLNACGVIVINPPWKLAADIKIFAPALVHVLGRETGCGYMLDVAPDTAHASA
jgi:23S rRNA (adenine2030-N6)-methyltransferase